MLVVKFSQLGVEKHIIKDFTKAPLNPYNTCRFHKKDPTPQVHTSYLSILVHRRIIEVYKKYTKKLSELATK